MSYNKFSDYLKTKYGQKVYKLPINLPVSCPNRDGKISTNGCIFCGEEGAGFESLSSNISIKDQITANSAYIGDNYGAKKFIAYFQNFSNTYMPFDDFKRIIKEAIMPNIEAIYISTRPDCINTQILEFLSNIKTEVKRDIVVELGLQTVNYHTLKTLKRGHTLAEAIDSLLAIKMFGLESCIHYIVDLPMDDQDDVIEGAKIISALGVDQVKCHSLYILKDTELGDMYVNGLIKPISLDEYIRRIILFLEYLDPKIVIQRLLGRAPKERSLFCNFNTSWWKIRDLIEEKMTQEGCYQGRNFNYLNGKSCKT